MCIGINKKTVKKAILITLILFSFLSCSIDDNNPTFHFEFVPTESVVMPESFEQGSVYSIEYSYFKPSSCHQFNELYYEPNNNIRTIAVINRVYHGDSNNSCSELVDQLETRSFQFLVNDFEEIFIFKFWQGVNEDGEDQYLIIEVPVE